MTHGERQSRNMWDAWREFRERDMGAEALANKPEYTKPSNFWFWVCGLEPTGGIAADFVLRARDLVALGYNPEAHVRQLPQLDRIQLQRLRWQWERKHCCTGIHGCRTWPCTRGSRPHRNRVGPPNDLADPTSEVQS